ncbi:MAG TPA: hypothetical protein VEC76_08655 [Streptosporangiaceae bacterium]|nr:hypothetical protein [Streptosporangiaceae bacterium]
MPRKVLSAAGALAAGLMLMACGSGGGSAATATSAPSPSVPASACLQQYRSWNAGPAHAAGETLVAALNALETASSESDVTDTGADLKNAATAANTLGHYPIPSCADPKGYWRAVLVRIQAAAASAGTAKGHQTLVAAQGALKDMPSLDLKLANELRQTVPGLEKSSPASTG